MAKPTMQMSMFVFHTAGGGRLRMPSRNAFQKENCVCRFPKEMTEPFHAFRAQSWLDFTAGRIVNGGRYTVTRIDGDRATLKDDLEGEAFEASLMPIGKCCLLAHAMVYSKVQGATENGSVICHDTSSKYFRREHLYVGLSRVTNGSNVFVA